MTVKQYFNSANTLYFNDVDFKFYVIGTVFTFHKEEIHDMLQKFGNWQIDTITYKITEY